MAKKAGAMTVAEAGRKGGKAALKKHGHAFYVKIGHKGGERMRKLIAAGKAALAKESSGG